VSAVDTGDFPGSVVPDWRERAARLRDELVAAGKLWSREWRDAVVSVPRHHFVPFFYERLPGAGWRPVSAYDPDTHQQWLDAVYANRSLVTQIGEVPDGGRDRTGPTSSASAPSLVMRMLEAIEVEDGHRVLEIGTGTGYNAALLSHRLGDRQVYSVDIDAPLVEKAGRRLDELGYRPTLVAGDGAAGLDAPGGFDRIIATCAVTQVPWAWAEQTVEGGLVLVDVKLHAAVGNLVLLRRLPDRLEGKFDAGTATFMQMRSPSVVSPASASRVRRDHSAARVRTADEPETALWENPPLWFLIHAREPGRIEFGYTQDPETGGPGAEFYVASDGSWCELTTLSDESRQVHEGGPHRLWTHIEDTIRQWRQLGQPGWDRLGLTVLADGIQRVWVDEPLTGSRTWAT
jgi:methyltransferase of ATP-grasp peptide maturase system